MPNNNFKNSPHHASEIINPDGSAPIILICEHASNHIPPEFDNLGLDETFLSQHIAYDIGMEQITRQMADYLDAPAIIANFSRLLIDPNRAEDQHGLIPHASDGVPIPGNQKLSEEQVNHRTSRFYHDFHDRTDHLVRHCLEQDITPLICGMHSFTPEMNGTRRPWQAGMLWDRDPRLAQALIRGLSRHGYHVGDNEPYTGRELFHTMTRHGAAHGLPHVTIEIRQDEVSDQPGITKWAGLLSEELTLITQNKDIRSIRKYYDE